MKYFTPEWYAGPDELEDFIPVFESYTHHLERMRGILPPEVLELATLPGVDDGLIVEVHHLRSLETLMLVLRCGNLQVGYYDLALTYEGAEISTRDEWTLARLARTTTDAWRHEADLAYHEVDAGPDGTIEHRLLFHPGRCFTVRCRKLRWSKIDRAGRDFPPLPDRFPGGPLHPPRRRRSGRIRAETARR